ncbi:MAG TPA: hypothetical protein PK863_03820 [Candidatus Dojkabacteria bacterium]|nr:hypothetical protein [Candidatus Dojkabacteria bacterium]
MFFISPKVSEFVKTKLGYTNSMWAQMQEEYIEIFLTYLEVEVNLELERKGLDDKIESLADIDDNQELINEFIKLYSEFPEVQEKVNEHMKKYFEGMIKSLLMILSKKNREELIKLINDELEKTTNYRKRLSELDIET